MLVLSELGLLRDPTVDFEHKSFHIFRMLKESLKFSLILGCS